MITIPLPTADTKVSYRFLTPKTQANSCQDYQLQVVLTTETPAPNSPRRIIYFYDWPELHQAPQVTQCTDRSTLEITAQQHTGAALSPLFLELTENIKAVPEMAPIMAALSAACTSNHPNHWTLAQMIEIFMTTPVMPTDHNPHSADSILGVRVFYCNHVMRTLRRLYPKHPAFSQLPAVEVDAPSQRIETYFLDLLAQVPRHVFVNELVPDASNIAGVRFLGE